MQEALSRLATTFRIWSEVGSQQMSPFYSMLAGRIAADPEVLEVAAHTRPGQPVPNMLFGAVRLLLDRGGDPELLSLYPTSADVTPDARVYPLFRDFVLDNCDNIVAVLQSRSVQTNIVRRAAVLLPGLMKVSRINGHRPFANIEIGASLGLTLLWQKFAYTYGDGFACGLSGSPVHITTRLTGKALFSSRPQMPDVLTNTGIEIAPVSLDDRDSTEWLEALIWPEHSDNRELWRAALSLAEQDPPRVLAGDALELLPAVIQEAPEGTTVSVYHSHTVNQFSSAARAALEETLCRESAGRLICRVSFEYEEGQACSLLRLFTYSGGVRTDEIELAQCEAHGRWIRWSDGPLN